MKLSALLLAALVPLASLGAGAQDVPSRAGRLAFIEGQAAVYQDPEIGWDRAYVNTPITSENSVWTDRRSRAEVRVSGVAIRMDELTQFDVARLDDDDISGFVPRGTLGVRIRHFSNDTRFDLATPQGHFRLFGEGRYRLDVDPERDETLLTVFAGAAALRSASGDVNVQAGNAVRITGGSRPAYYFERVAAHDFDRWVQARDERWVERQSLNYVSTYMTGYEDLDAYGQWSREPDFGALWYPTRVAADWAPYRHGHWSYVRPWGWTWVDDAPWGYAPFHYGRWVYVRNRWAWAPGERVTRPVWAPALVAWVGGSGASLRIGVGGGPTVGWYPLSPWDRYDPWFQAPSSYVSQVNIIVNNFSRRGDDSRRREWYDRTRERGATVVNREQFQAGRPVAQAVIPVSADVVRQMPQASPTQVLPSRTEVMQRRAQLRSSQPQVVAPPSAPATAAAPQVQGRPTVSGAPSTAPQASAPGRSARESNAPTFTRPQNVPAPQAAQGSQPPAQAGRGPSAAPAPQAVPPRDARVQELQRQQAAQQQERERREAEELAARQRLLEGRQSPEAPAAPQAQQRQQREAQQAQQKAQQDAQQAQQKAQQDAQQAQQRQQQETQRQQREAQQAQQRQQQEAQQAQQRQQQAQERQQREAAQAQQRAQQEAKQAEQRQQQLQQQQQQAQERQQREAAQAQKAQQEAQRQQREAAQAQQKAQQEAQRQQQRAQPQPAQPQPAQPQPVQPQPAQPQPAQPQNQGQGRGRGQQPKEKDKDEEDKDKKK